MTSLIYALLPLRLRFVMDLPKHISESYYCISTDTACLPPLDSPRFSLS